MGCILRDLSQRNRKQWNHATKSFTVKLLLCLTAIIIFVMVLFIAHAGHECLGQDCHICTRINDLKTLLGSFSKSVSSGFSAAALSLALVITILDDLFKMLPSSPFSNRVKLNI